MAISVCMCVMLPAIDVQCLALLIGAFKRLPFNVVKIIVKISNENSVMKVKKMRLREIK